MNTWIVVAALAATPMTLDEVKAASRRNLEAVRAELAVERAQAGRTQARSAILPQVGLNLGVSDFIAGPQRTFSTVPVQQADGSLGFEQRAVDTPGFSRGNFQLSLTVTQLIYDGGRWWNQLAQAGAQEEAAKGQLDEQRLASELEAVRRFYELVRAQLTLKVLEASVDRSREQVRRAQGLYEAGRAQRREVLDAEVNLGNDEIGVLRQRQAIQSAQVDLARWLGRADELEAVPPKEIEPATQPAPAPALDAALAIARERRPLLRALDRQVAVADRGVAIARADYLPRLSAQASYQRSSPSADPFFTDPTKQNALTLGVNLSWDLFSGFLTDAQVARARVELTEQQLQQKQALVELEGELKRSLETLKTQVAVATLAERNRALAANKLDLEEQRYAAGAGSSLEVRDAQLKLTQAQLSQLQGRIDVELARAALVRVAGAAVEGTP